MTARQMQIAFQDAFERSGLELNLTSTELFKELNDAQDIIVAELFSQFEATNQVSAALAPLVIRNLEIETDYPGVNTISGYTIDRANLPSNFRFFISLTSKVEWVYGGYSGTTVDSGTNNRTVDDVGKDTSYRFTGISQQDDIYRMLADPFNRPNFRGPVAVLHDSFIDVYSDNSTFVVPNVYLDYLKDPDQISITGAGTPSELPDELHRQIVDTAVERYLQRVTGVRSTTTQAE